MYFLDSPSQDYFPPPPTNLNSNGHIRMTKKAAAVGSLTYSTYSPAHHWKTRTCRGSSPENPARPPLSLHTSSYLLHCFHPFSHILPSTASIQILKFCRHSNNCRLQKLPPKMLSLYACWLLPTLCRLSPVMVFRENQRYWESANEFKETDRWTDKR